MHIVQKKIPTFSAKWCGLQLLSAICWCISIVAAIGSIQGVIGEDLSSVAYLSFNLLAPVILFRMKQSSGGWTANCLEPGPSVSLPHQLPGEGYSKGSPT